MAIRRAVFFNHVRAQLFGGKIRRLQMSGMTAILDRWDYHEKGRDLRHLAYMMATVFHETAYTMQPVRETLAASDGQAVERLEAAFAAGKLSWVKTPYWRRDEDGRSWHGRGLVQLTHKRNYQAMSQVTGIDLVAEPDRAMEMDVAVAILFEGMRLGSFTSHRLDDYFNAETEDWLTARRIINGMDRAERLAGHGQAFYAALGGY